MQGLFWNKFFLLHKYKSCFREMFSLYKPVHAGSGVQLRAGALVSINAA